MAKQLFTIGYSGFPDADEFVRELKKYGVQIVIDVRSSPYSAYYSVYNREPLSAKLKDSNIFYYNYSRQFGARQEDLSFYKNGRLDFASFSKSPQFLDGVKSVEKSNAVIAFMCGEKHPSECHRSILVAKAFSDRGHEIVHIKPNNETLTQHDVDAELVETYFPNRAQESLFEEDNMTEDEYIAEAYKRRNDEIGYKLEDLEK